MEEFLLLENGGYLLQEDGASKLLLEQSEAFIQPTSYRNIPMWAVDIIPSLMVQSTDAQVFDQSITYNQIGVSYNDSRYSYGGIYKAGEDIVPLISIANTPTPSIIGYADIYTTPTPPPVSGHNSIGPGFFMFITNN